MAAVWLLNAFDSMDMQKRNPTDFALRLLRVGVSSFDQKKSSY